MYFKKQTPGWENQMRILAVKWPYIPHERYACVYKLKFGMGYFYIGATMNLDERLDNHVSHIKNGTKNIAEYISCIKGKYTVCVEILEELPDVTKLNEREQFYLDQFVGHPKCLNVSKHSSINAGLKRMLDESKSFGTKI